MTHALERLLRLQRGDLPRGMLLFAYLFLVICAYLMGQVGRDALFLGRFDASLLPFADMALFVLVAVVIALYVRAGRRLSLDRLIVGSLATFAVVCAAFAVLAHGSPPDWLFPGVYVWVGVLGVVAPAQVWTLANWVLTPREARRLFGFIGAGATLGATVGGFLSSALARRLGAESLLAAMALLLLVASVLVKTLWARRPTALRSGEAAATAPESVGLRASLRLVLGSGHLRAITVIVVLSSFVTAVASWQFKAVAQQSLVSKDAMAAFFGSFNAWVGVLCVATQFLLTTSVLRRLGLGPVLFLLPLGLLSGAAGLLTFASLAAAILLKGVDKVLRYSIDRPAMELLYLPVPTTIKLPAKSFIDTVAWRAGDGLAGLVVAVLATLGGLPANRLSLVTLPAIGVWLLLASRVHHRYVATLEESLQQHKLDAERASLPALDRETTEVLATRLGAVDPKEVLYALELLESGRQAAAHPAVRGLLDHADAEVRRRALAILSEAGELSVLPRAEALLHDPALEVRTEALLYLSRHAQVDPLSRLSDLADFPDFSVRAAVVAVLARLGNDRLEAAEPLFAAMVAEAGEPGRRTRLEAARLAERMALPFEQALARLLGDEDAEVARTAIRAVARNDPRPFVSQLVERLGDAGLAADARDALVAAGEEALPQLADALANRRTASAVRRALPGVLERIGGEPAAAVLADNLLDGDAALRLRVLVALAGVRDACPELPLDTRLVEAALGAEVLGHYRSYQVLGTLPAGPGREGVERGLRAAMSEELERVFRLLDLLHPRRDFRAAWVALQSGNAVIHDQALDLLESLLRPETKALLVPLVDPEIPEAQRVRLAQRLVGAPVETLEQGIEALASTGDPWLRSCAAFAIGSLELASLTHHLEAWRDDPDPLLRESVRQARQKLSAARERRA